MLSRHAEDVCWAGRYLERAQDTARILDVTYHTLLSTPAVEQATAWEGVLEVLGLSAHYRSQHGAVDHRLVHEYLLLDRTNSGSITSLVRRTRENVRGVRVLLSTEFWEAVNDLWLRLAARDLSRDLDEHPAQLYGLVKTGTQTVMGAADETMTRDEAWSFLHLGALLERAEMTCRLVDVHVRRLVEDDQLTTVGAFGPLLRSASASEAFLRTGQRPDAGDVVGFLLLSRSFPRSVLYSLVEAERHMAAVAGPNDRSRARRLMGRLRAELEYADVHELISGGLTTFLASIQADVREVTEAVADRFFPSVYDLAVQSVLVRSGEEVDR
jgi:uncharacterized alpha-E superfamily protein